MKYNFTDLDLKEYLTQIDGKLNIVEVKGDSVMYLSQARILLSTIFNAMEEIPKEKEKEE